MAKFLIPASIFKLSLTYFSHRDFQPFSWSFPRTDIYKLISVDILHQIVKGVFKDHLVTWVTEYIAAEYGEKEGKKRMDEFDNR